MRTVIGVVLAAAVSSGATVHLFEPDRALTRCEYATAEWRQAGSPVPSPAVEPWPDVPADSHCATASRWLREQGIFEGVEVDAVSAAIAVHWSDIPDKATRVAFCESRLNPAAVGGVGERGLFQVHPGWWTSWGVIGGQPLVYAMGYLPDDLFDPFVNAEVARAIYDIGGGTWGAWTCGYA